MSDDKDELSEVSGRHYRYTTNNYEPLNSGIENLTDRYKNSTYLNSIEKFWIFSRAFTLFFCGLAVGILILAVAYYIYSRSSWYLNDSVGEYVKRAEKIIVTIPDEKKSKVIEKTIIIEKPVFTPIKIPIKSGAVSNFTIFQSSSIELKNGTFSVTTGLNFDSSEDSYPSYQFCYIRARNNDRDYRNQKTLYIGKKEGASDAIFHNFYDIKDIKIVIDEGDFVKAQKRCHFLSKDGPNRKETRINPPIPKGDSSGSGFFVNEDGYVVTNEHVVSDCKEIRLRTPYNSYTAVLISKVFDLDLAILKIYSPRQYDFVEFAGEIRTGEDVVALGFPLNDVLGKVIKATTGNISAMVGLKGDPKTLQFTAPIQPGSSGGPLLNQKGALVGINSSGLRGKEFENINFAIKSIVLQQYLATNKIDFTSSNQEKKIDTADIVELGNLFSVQIFCMNE